MPEPGAVGQAVIGTFHAVAGSGRQRVEGVALAVGRDLTVTLGGGTHYHVGAGAVAVPRPSLDDPGRLSASASVICVTGHKEDELARAVALRLATLLDRVVVVTAGLHVDGAVPDDLKALLTNAEEVVGALADEVAALPNPGAAAGHPGAGREPSVRTRE